MLIELGKPFIIAYGRDIDGDLAAVKKLISGKDLFLNSNLLAQERIRVIDDLDLTGISVADLLRNPSNFPYYSQRNTDAFANVVEKILNNNNFEIAIRTVKTANTTSYNQSSILRLKNVNSDFSDNFREAITNGTKPVVMAGGIFSTLTEWENNGNGLARDLVNEGHNVWEIELTGGDNIECSTCPDYTYQDLVDYYWPALVAGVMNYSGKNQVHYVGHSNGCRVALSSLNNYSNTGKNSVGLAFDSVTGLYNINISLPSHSVDKFFGVACPAVANAESAMISAIRVDLSFSDLKVGPLVMSSITKKHVRMNDFTIKATPLLYIEGESTLGFGILTFSSLLPTYNKISRNLLNFYVNLAINESSQFDVSNLNVSEIIIYHSKPNDFLVPYEDQAILFNNLTITNKYNITVTSGLFPLPFYNDHSYLKSNSKVKENIIEELK